MFLAPSLAERVGFEPTVPLPAHVLSRHAESAALAPLRANIFERSGILARGLVSGKLREGRSPRPAKNVICVAARR